MATSSYALYNNSVVFVRQLDDLPAPSGGVITLAASTTYIISGTIVLGTNRIVFGSGGAIVGTNQATDILVYTGTGNMFTITDIGGLIKLVTISCASGTVFSASSSTGIDNFLLDGVVFSSCKTIGTITGFLNWVITACIMTGNTTGGITIGNTYTNTNFAVLSSEFVNNAGTLLNFGSGTIVSAVVHGNIFNTSAGQTVLAGTPTVTGKINIANSTFIGDGTYTSQNIVSTNIYCDFNNNIGVSDSSATGEASFSANASSTTITVQGTFYKAAGTSAGGTNERFTHTNNRLTYNGLETVSLLVECSFSASTGNNNQTLGARIAKNGVTIAGSESELRQNTASQAEGGVAKSIVVFSTNDYVELFVTNKTATNAVTVEYMNLTAR